MNTLAAVSLVMRFGLAAVICLVVLVVGCAVLLGATLIRRYSRVR